MTITITAGHTSGPITISSGDPLIVLSGGEVYSATILNGGSATLSSGGVGIDVTVSKGGLLVGPGELEANSQDYGDVVRALLEGSLEVRSGGVADEVTVSGGGLVIDANGLTVGTVLSNDGTETISSGGFASGTKVESGGVLLLSAGGTAVAATVSSAGLLVFGGALSANFTYDYGPETTSAVLGGVTVSSGGGLEITGATVLSGATLTLGAGTNVDGLTIDKDAKLAGTGALDGDSTAAGSVSAVTVAGGLELLAGGVASGVTVSGAGGALALKAGASATATVVRSGGYELVSSGAAAATTTLLSGGRAYVYAGGHASATRVTGGGAQVVLSAGSTSAAVISGGGGEIVSSGGAAADTTVLSGGRATIYAGGAAIGLGVRAGGVLVDEGEVRIGGAATLDGTLTGSGAIVQTLAGDLVLGAAGTDFSGRVVTEGGTIELASAGAIGTGVAQFVEPATGSAVLQIDAADAPAAGGTFANTIEGFSGVHEQIDLRNLAFVAGASAKVVGSTLVLTDGGKTYSFKLAGGAADAFSVLSDGHGGTLIDPKAAAFTQAAAAFAPTDAARTSLVSSPSPTAHAPFLHAAAGRP